MCRIDALDVECRVRLGVTQCLRLGQNIGKGAPLVTHLGEDEVAGAIDDPGDPLDVVGRQPLAQRLDDRDPPRNRGLECYRHALVLRSGEDLIAMQGDQRLVGRDHVLAVRDRLHDQFAGRRIAADQLDDDIDFRIVDHRKGVVTQLDSVQPLQTLGPVFACGRVGDQDLAPGSTRDLGGIPHQHIEGAAADGPQAQQADFDRIQDTLPSCSLSGNRTARRQPATVTTPSRRNISLIPRIA